jgi:hypothetical protein
LVCNLVLGYLTEPILACGKHFRKNSIIPNSVIVKMRNFLCRCLFLTSLFIVLCIKQAPAFAILAHEAIIDASWEKSIKPLLLLRFPGTTDSAMKDAHAYAYGGAMIADIGYMPFGSMEFSDMMHYVRSGDMVQAMLDDARDINELAFAIGALSHYLTDEYGHSKATNVTVPLLKQNRKLRKKYGDFITYGDDHTSHSRLEFSYDVLQLSRGIYTSQAYHDFIGFKVSEPVLERAFLKIYGLKLDDVFSDFNSAVGTLRWGVNNLIPAIIKMTWRVKRDSIMKRQPTMTARKFKYQIKRREYYAEFGKTKAHEVLETDLITFIIRVAPKIGPFKTFKYVDPGQIGEKLFIKSFDTITAHFARNLVRLQHHNLALNNVDFDTGRPTVIDEYDMADQAYAKWLIQLDKEHFEYVTPVVKESLLNFYSDPQLILYSSRYPFNCDELEQAIDNLKQASPQHTIPQQGQ